MNRSIPFLCLAFLVCGAVILPAYAANTDNSKKQELAAIEEKVKAEKERQDNLRKEAEKLESGMKGLKTNLINATLTVQKQERALQGIQEQLDDLQTQKTTMEDGLDKQKLSLANLIVAMERIRRLPPETLIARPDAPLETAQAATIMGSVMPEINKRAEALKTKLETLSKIENDLNERKAELEDKTEKLKTDKEKMDALVAERAQTLKSTQSKVAAKDVEIASLTKEAKDFRDLIQKIERKKREEAKQAKKKRKIFNDEDFKEDKDSSPKGAFTTLAAGRAPVSGIVKTGYGDTDDIGATSKGLTYQSRAGSVVVAPLAGAVRYAGNFRNYGKIILIEHKNKFHSLIAGLGKLDTFVGQRVDAGEPIGTLPNDTGRLYYELRYQGDPVNPSKKFSQLN